MKNRTRTLISATIWLLALSAAVYLWIRDTIMDCTCKVWFNRMRITSLPQKPYVSNPSSSDLVIR